MAREIEDDPEGPFKEYNAAIRSLRADASTTSHRELKARMHQLSREHRSCCPTPTWSCSPGRRRTRTSTMGTLSVRRGGSFATDDRERTDGGGRSCGPAPSTSWGEVRVVRYLPCMSNPATVGNLVANLALFAVIMLLVLGVLGGGVGPIELLTWVLVLVFGVGFLFRRHRTARRSLPPEGLQ